MISKSADDTKIGNAVNYRKDSLQKDIDMLVGWADQVADEV